MSDNLRVMLTLTVVGGEWPQSTITLGLPDQAALVDALCAEVRKRVPVLLSAPVWPECLGSETSCGCEVHDQGPVQDGYVPGYADDGTPEPEEAAE